MNIDQVRLFAEAAHGGKFYHEKFPYSYHLTHVALNAIKFGFGDDEEIMQACYLHDVLEDTKITSDDLRRLGIADTVIELVECVTDGPGANRKERKAFMYPKCAANNKAIVVKLCDRIANLEESVKTRSRQFATYFSEHADFEKELRHPGDSRVDMMWEYLHRLVYTSC